MAAQAPSPPSCRDHGLRRLLAAFGTVAVALLFLSHQCTADSLNRRLLAASVNATATSSYRDGGGAPWSTAGATWFGGPESDGNDGGACGYGSAVGRPPFSSMITAGGASLYKSGKGCGACYQIMCTDHLACSGKPVTVVITDVCFGGPFPAWSPHFDLSGTSFGAMALPGHGYHLRNAGILSILFRRTECNYPGMHIAFHVQAGSSPYYLAVLVEYEDGDGDLSGVELHQSKPSSPLWLPMQQSYGAVWRLNPGSALQAPFSFRLTTLTSGKTMIVGDVVPANWQPGETYRSLVNFSA